VPIFSPQLSPLRPARLFPTSFRRDSLLPFLFPGYSRRVPTVPPGCSKNCSTRSPPPSPFSLLTHRREYFNPSLIKTLFFQSRRPSQKHPFAFRSQTQQASSCFARFGIMADCKDKVLGRFFSPFIHNLSFPPFFMQNFGLAPRILTLHDTFSDFANRLNPGASLPFSPTYLSPGSIGRGSHVLKSLSLPPLQMGFFRFQSISPLRSLCFLY